MWDSEHSTKGDRPRALRETLPRILSGSPVPELSIRINSIHSCKSWNPHSADLPVTHNIFDNPIPKS